MKRRIARLFAPIAFLFLLAGCAENPSSIPEEEPPTEDEELVLDSSLSKEVAQTASYLNEVPYVSTATNDPKGRARPLNTDGIPQDEDGYYDISSPTSSYSNWSELELPLSWYESFDTELKNAKNTKNEAFANCRSLNKWRNDSLMLFDVNTKELEFCKRRYGTIYTGDGPLKVLFFDRGDIYKDDSGRINFRFSECEVNLGITDCEPVYHQTSILYLEGEHYICSQCNRAYRDPISGEINSHGFKTNTLYSESMTTFYIDLLNIDVMYGFSCSTRSMNDGGPLANTVSREVFDFQRGLSVRYGPTTSTLELYDEGGHSAVRTTPGGGTTINLYDFDGWDYFYTKTLDRDDASTNTIKFKLSNDNIDELSFQTEVTFNYWADFDPITLKYGDDYFSGYPTLSFSSPDYESFELFMDRAGLVYQGGSDGLQNVEKFYNGEFEYTLFGQKITEITDDDLRLFIQDVCENYEYSELEELLLIQKEAIPLETNIMDSLFEMKNGVSFDEETLLLSRLEVSINNNPYLVPEQEYVCSVELIDSGENSIDIVAETSFIYGTDETLKFKDVDLKDLASRVTDGNYFLALNFNGYRALLSFGDDICLCFSDISYISQDTQSSEHTD